jgi:hypothetical protein
LQEHINQPADLWRSGEAWSLDFTRLVSRLGRAAAGD